MESINHLLAFLLNVLELTKELFSDNINAQKTVRMEKMPKIIRFNKYYYPFQRQQVILFQVLLLEAFFLLVNHFAIFPLTEIWRPTRSFPSFMAIIALFENVCGVGIIMNRLSVLPCGYGKKIQQIIGRPIFFVHACASICLFVDLFLRDQALLLFIGVAWLVLNIAVLYYGIGYVAKHDVFKFFLRRYGSLDDDQIIGAADGVSIVLKNGITFPVSMEAYYLLLCENDDILIYPKDYLKRDGKIGIVDTQIIQYPDAYFFEKEYSCDIRFLKKETVHCIIVRGYKENKETRAHDVRILFTEKGTNLVNDKPKTWRYSPDPEIERQAIEGAESDMDGFERRKQELRDRWNKE